MQDYTITYWVFLLVGLVVIHLVITQMPNETALDVLARLLMAGSVGAFCGAAAAHVDRWRARRRQRD